MTDAYAAIVERARNVVIDASAGTGKTWLLVERIVELVAPRGEQPAIAIERLAAISFTRKAASELRVRARQRLLEELARAPLGPRARALRAALDGLDTAQLATIHGFADHLLRQWPAHMGMDPYYELDEHEADLHRACVDALADVDGLRARLAGSPVAARGAEAAETLLAIDRAGLRWRSEDTEHATLHGFDSLVAAFASHRDIDLADPPAPVFDAARFRRFAHEYVERVSRLAPCSPGARWLIEVAAAVARACDDDDPAALYGQLAPRIRRRSSDRLSKRDDFPGDDAGWAAWKAIADGKGRARPLADDLLDPLRRWLALRLVRLRPVALHVYRQVKAERRAVDHLDLVLRLRDLLRDDPDVRARCQAQYDHVLVDELQDTDPVQAEVIALLCARPGSAAIAPGTLTVVGDPKQLIYRFRRADIATYEQLRAAVVADARSVALTASRRTTPALVEWINHRFAQVMAVAGRFSADTGEVGYQPLAPSRAGDAAPAVHAVPLVPGDDVRADALRGLEADAMARYLRWLVELGDMRIRDPLSEEPRRVHYGDIGVLAISTTRLPQLFAAFDRDGVPYAARGGTLFLGDALHRQFLLGLCGLADRDDGVAVTALLRPPFFPSDSPAARAAIRALRRHRFTRPPGATARRLIEDTALGPSVARRANGAQQLRGLYELCHQLELRALDGADFDAAVEAMRGWIDHPIQLDRPSPVDGDAVRVMTIHQAKGLEFPVVVMWDALAEWTEPRRQDVWTSDGTAWDLRLDGLAWCEPTESSMVARERAFRDAERKRLAYVAATRARDLLILPRLRGGTSKHIWHTLLDGSPAGLVHDAAPHAARAPAAWYQAAEPPRTEVDPRDAPLPWHAAETTRDAASRDATPMWRAAAAESAQPRLVPHGFAHARDPRAWWGTAGRHGTAFGHTVHVAIADVLTSGAAASDAVAKAAARCGHDGRRREAVADVTRAVAALAWLVPGRFRIEYPIATGERDRLFAGYIDLVADLGDHLAVVDFKTDLPPASPANIPVAYRDQVCGYARALGRSRDTLVRAGLLFTADGEIRWLS